ncbi:MAG TPA: tetratricopeptide repeat protein [Hyphomicrobiaceae bacterium]|nr:tetratricopeptide repeat protein [Hyphomicrobiaceae bacterium]
MTQSKDSLGVPVSGASAEGLTRLETAVHQFQCYIGDPVATLAGAAEASPDMPMGHLLNAYLHLLGTEPTLIATARELRDRAARLPMNDRERGHLQAVSHLIDGRWHAAARALEDISIAYPRDAIALQAGHVIDFFIGDARMLRDRIARALPAWEARMPGYHALLGMHAFGLEEMGEYAKAEAQGRRGVELEPRDGWAQHAVAHVMEMQGRHRDGIAWMRADPDAWSRESFFCVHNWWHLALYHLDLGDIDEVLALFDGPIYGARSGVVLDMIDASALLWRLHLRGIEVGDRWQAVADKWEPIAGAGTYAFNDAHAMMAFVGAGRTAAMQAVIEAQVEAMRRADDNARFTGEVGHAVTMAIKAFGDGNYGDTVRLLRPVRNIANRFGGSHAQRDILDLTLIEAAFRSGDGALAAALAAERVEAKPTSPLARLFVERARSVKRAA